MKEVKIQIGDKITIPNPYGEEKDFTFIVTSPDIIEAIELKGIRQTIKRIIKPSGKVIYKGV